MIDLCGTMSGDATPRFSALWGLWSMPIKSWFCRYEFMVLPHGKPNTTIFESFALYPGHSKLPPGELELPPVGVCPFFSNFPLVIPTPIVIDCVRDTLAKILPPSMASALAELDAFPRRHPLPGVNAFRAVAKLRPLRPLAPSAPLPPHAGWMRCAHAMDRIGRVLVGCIA